MDCKKCGYKIAMDNVLGELPEKNIIDEQKYIDSLSSVSLGTRRECLRQNIGRIRASNKEAKIHNQALDLCKPILAKKELRIGEMIKQRKLLINFINKIKIQDSCWIRRSKVDDINALKNRIRELEEHKRLYEGESQAHFNCVSENAELQQELAKLRECYTCNKISEHPKYCIDCYSKLEAEDIKLQELVDKYVCKNCYGKGYSTEYQGKTIARADFIGDRDKVLENEKVVKHYCTCIVGIKLRAITYEKDN